MTVEPVSGQGTRVYLDQSLPSGREVRRTWDNLCTVNLIMGDQVYGHARTAMSSAWPNLAVCAQ